MSCSKTIHCASGQARTRNHSLSSQEIYHSATCMQAGCMKPWVLTYLISFSKKIYILLNILIAYYLATRLCFLIFLTIPALNDQPIINVQCVLSVNTALTHSVINVIKSMSTTTVLPAKSDSDIMFCLQVIRDLQSIYHLCINPIRRIELIHK